MIIGLIVAIETAAVFGYYEKVERLDAPVGYQLFQTEKADRTIYVLQAGMGEIAASAGVQYLISKCGAEVIVNFGVVRGLTSDMKKRKVCVVDRVVHYKYDCSEFMDLAVGQVDGHDSVFLPTTPECVEKALVSYPALTRATCCSGDKFVGTEEEKTYLHETFKGDVCDMESAGIVLTCEMNGVPCLLLKAVSDGLAGDAKEFYEELYDASFQCLFAADCVMEAL